MWTQDRIVAVSRKSGSLQVVVRFVSDAGHAPLEESYGLANRVEGNWLAPFVRATLDRLNGLDLNEAELAVGQVVDISPVVVDPERETFEADRRAYFAMAGRLEVLRKAEAPDADITALVTQLKAAYKPEYIG